mgnify:CR=1
MYLIRNHIPETAINIKSIIASTHFHIFPSKKSIISASNAGSAYGTRGKQQAQALIAEVSGLFAGGDMAEEDMDEMMKAIQDAYWIAKEKNRKYTPKKYSDKK